jgi:hypothetical protein
MLKNEYQALRGLLRSNGSYAYQWMLPSQQAIFKALGGASGDHLQAREAWSRINCNPRMALELFAPIGIFMAWKHRFAKYEYDARMARIDELANGLWESEAQRAAGLLASGYSENAIARLILRHRPMLKSRHHWNEEKENPQ